jgi:hypothetical protein
MKRFITLIISIIASASLYAGTPAEDLMLSAAESKGVQVIEGKGFLMKFARSAIRKTPLKPLADQVTEVTVCKMEKAPEDFITGFVGELREILKAYQFYGIKPGEEGRLAEVYGNYPENGIVTELVVFNPELNSLFSLRGRYTVEELISIDQDNPKK